MTALIAFSIAMVGTLVIALAFFNGAKVEDNEPEPWGDPLMPARREAIDAMLRTELESRAHRRDVNGPEFRDRR